MEDGLYGLQFGGCYVGDEELHSTRVHHPSPPPPPLLEADGGYEVNNHSHHFLPHHHYEGFPLSTAVASFDLPSSCQWMQTGNSTVISDAASRMAVEMEEEESVSLAAARAKIAAHPLYPKLVQAYIDCQKVGAPPEVADILEKIRRESEASDKTGTFCLGADPELDEFMEAYCDTLMRFKSDLSRPFEEATSFLKKVETQLNTLCKGSFPTTHISVIELFEEIENRRPGGISFTDLPAVLKIKKELCEAQSIDEYQVPDDLLERLVSGHGEFPPVCAILGGILGQEVIKAVSSKGEPLKNFFFFDVFNGKGVIEDVSNGNASSNFPITPNLVEHFQLID